MKVLIIGTKEAVFWKKVVKKTIPDAEVSIYDRNYNGSIAKKYGMLIATVPNPELIETALKEQVTTISTVLPTKNPDVAEKLFKIADFNKTTFVVSPKFIYTDVFAEFVVLVEKLGALEFIGIDYADPGADDIVWDLGRTAGSILLGVMPGELGIDGVGLYTHLDIDKRKWLNATLFTEEGSDLVVNLNLSKYGPEINQEVKVVGEKGSALLRVGEQEIVVKDNNGRRRTRIGTNTLSQEEQMLICALNIPEEYAPCGETNYFTTALLNSLDSQFFDAEEIADLTDKQY